MQQHCGADFTKISGNFRNNNSAASERSTEHLEVWEMASDQ